MTDKLIRLSDALAEIEKHMYADEARDAIAALPAVSAPGVKVRALEWTDFEGRGAKAQAWNEANYMIQKCSDGRWEISASYPGYSTFIEGADRFYPTLDAAKAAAQADYEARILAALEQPAITEPAPDEAHYERHTVEALVRLLKEARDDIAEYVNADYPVDYRAQYPDMARRYNRDMELCRRIDTALAPAEAGGVAKLVEAGNGLHSIVEGVQGAMEHGTWRDEKGQRLKDTPEWVAFHNARAAITEAEQ